MSEHSMYENIFKPKLYSNLCVPSTVHAYSLGIEYMRDWVLSKFKDGNIFFPTVYVNGSHLFSDFKRFNPEQNLKKAKPMLAIVPDIDTDFDRDYLDMYLGSPNLLLTKNNFNRSIIEDKEKGIYMGIGSELLLMNFQFTVRVSSRSEQLDLWKFIQLYFRIGATEGNYIDLDFHIPNSLIYGIAELAGFDLIYDDEGEIIEIKNIYEFLTYLNTYSLLPVIYKLRAVNGNSEFFFRMPNQYMHIAFRDKIQLGDGDLQGKLYNNFDLTFSCTLRMPAPKYYFLYTIKEIKNPIKLKEIADIGIDNIKVTDVPEINEKGWSQYINTEYILDEFPNKYPYTIPLRSFFTNKDIMNVINDTLNQGITPDIFLNIEVWNNGYNIFTKMNWETKELIIEHPFHNLRFFIAIYIDMKYYNNKLIELKNIYKSRTS